MNDPYILTQKVTASGEAKAGVECCCGVALGDASHSKGVDSTRNDALVGDERPGVGVGDDCPSRGCLGVDDTSGVAVACVGCPSRVNLGRGCCAGALVASGDRCICKGQHGADVRNKDGPRTHAIGLFLRCDTAPLLP